MSKVLHEYGALAFWDYATAAPYIEIEMHPLVSEGDASKDAIFFSPHKFIGGVESPGEHFSLKPRNIMKLFMLILGMV